jgi:predicted glycosyl hydrolase (DUF1957 family)
MALELHHILPGVGSWSQHRHHQYLQNRKTKWELAALVYCTERQRPAKSHYLIDDAAISVQREPVLHEVAARLPEFRLLPGRPEYATDDGDGFSAG